MSVNKELKHKKVNNSSHRGEMSATIPNCFIGLDVGGSHVSGAIVDTNASVPVQHKLLHRPLDTTAYALPIINAIGDVIKEVAEHITGAAVVGIAMPGPFNYKKG